MFFQKNIFSIRRSVIAAVCVLSLLLVGTAAYAQSTATSTFSITIGAGSISVNFVNASDATVSTPTIAFGSYSRSATCGSVTGTLGSSTAKIRVANDYGANNGWSLDLSALETARWADSGSSNHFDYNDPGNTGALGCSDKSSAPNADTDSEGGQLTVNMSPATITAVSGGSTGITKGAGGAFVGSGAVRLITAAAGSADAGTWDLTGVGLSQKIPADQANATYSLSMTHTVTAS